MAAERQPPPAFDAAFLGRAEDVAVEVELARAHLAGKDHRIGEEPDHVAVAGVRRRSGCRAACRAWRAPRDARLRHGPAPAPAASAGRRACAAPRGAGGRWCGRGHGAWVMTSTPRSISMFWMSMTSRSLPGMAQDEKITRSPALRSIAGCSSRAMRAIAARGSPWLPVTEQARPCLRGRFLYSS